MKKRKVLIIFGGYSTEYYISCKSAGSVVEYIDNDLFDVVKVGITIDGEWVYTEATSEQINDGLSWLELSTNKKAIISPRRNKKELLIINNDSIDEIHIDCAFPLIHGYGGEDGSIQGLLEVSNIPYVGSGINASANAIDKELTRIFADKCDLKQPRCIVMRESEYKNNKYNFNELIDFEYPLFVKPASLGSSIGITRVDHFSQLDNALAKAFQFEDKILIEQGIIGSEIKVAILGNEELNIGEICELKVPEDGINDYVTKYINCSSIKIIPAKLDKQLEHEVKKQACAIYRELNCKGFARVDFFLSKEGELYFNEINTIPGISKNSVFSLMFEKKGITYKDIITNLIELSFQSTKQVNELDDQLFKNIV